MNNPFTKTPSALDIQIKTVLRAMDRFDPTEEEYPALLKTLERLEELRDKKKRWAPSPDSVLAGGVALLQVGMILNAERLQVLATKAWGQVLRPRN